MSDGRPDSDDKRDDAPPSGEGSDSGTTVKTVGPGKVVRRSRKERERRVKEREARRARQSPFVDPDSRPSRSSSRGGPRGPGGGGRRFGSGRGPGGPGGRRGAPARNKRANVDPEKEARRAKATALSKEKGIPLAHAHRIVQGRTTLNDVLKAMMRQERFERLVRRDGLDPSLAGQVASGHLSKERALVVTRIRRFRKHPLDHDAIKIAEIDAEPVALDVFGRGFEVGKVTAARVYDFDLEKDGGETEALHKHDVKIVAAPDDHEAVQSVKSVDEDVKGQGLSATAERSERVRPTDEQLLDAVEAERTVTIVTRDGQVLKGQVVSFGRWDLSLEVAGDFEDRDAPVVKVLFHALHKNTEL